MKKLGGSLLLVVVGAVNWVWWLAEFDLWPRAGLDWRDERVTASSMDWSASRCVRRSRSFALVGGRERQMSGVV
jgi:hypothetical protein